MENYKKEFIEFMVMSGVLTFGDFVTKSGRSTPFFINTGNYDNGEQMTRLGEFYAAAIEDRMTSSFDCLFGPAYKGIPLVITSSIALNVKHLRNVNFCFNRKEIKDHGEGGNLVGHKLQDGERIIIIEDVTTSGASIRETVPILMAEANVKLEALVVSVDRMEKGTGELSALQEIEDDYGMKTFAIVTLDEIVSYLHNRPIENKVILTDALLEKIVQYRAMYGV